MSVIEQPTLATGEKAGWVFWNDAFGVAYHYNSVNYVPGINDGACVSVSQGPTGTYTVTFCELGNGGAGGNVQVVAVGPGNQRCKVDSWSGSIDLTVQVRCHNGAGALTNSAFIVEYASFTGGQSPSSLGAYVWMDQPTGGTLSTGYMWGDTITVSHLATGRYELTFSNQNMNAGNVQVTAYGTGTEHCKVESWSAFKAKVRCYLNATTLANTRFSLRYTLGSSNPTCGMTPDVAGPGIHDSYRASGGYVRWTGSIPAQYMFSIFETLFNCDDCVSGTPVTINNPSAGKYVVHYADFTSNNSESKHQLPLVTAFGVNARYCKILSWKTDSAGTDVNVDCRTGNGVSFSNTDFSQLLFSNTWSGC